MKANAKDEQLFDAGFLPLIKTVDDVLSYLEQIDIVLKSLYIVSGKPFSQFLQEATSYHVSQMLLWLFKEKNIQDSDTTSLRKILESCKVYLRSLPILTLTLAVEPTEVMVTDILQWGRQNLEKNLVLALKHDQKIVAGAVIVYNGHYIDRGYRDRLHKALEKHQSDFAQLLA